MSAPLGTSKLNCRRRAINEGLWHAESRGKAREGDDRESRLNILVTDASYKHAVGMIRALGRAGHRVIAVATSRFAPGRFSRYAERCVQVRSAAGDPDGFVDDLLGLVTTFDINLVIPVGFASTEAVVRHRDRFLSSKATIVVPTADTFGQAADKLAMTQVAEGLGIAVPETVSVDDVEAVRAFVSKYPRGIVKARRESLIKGARRVEFTGDAASDLERIQAALPVRGAGTAILQEFIPGTGAGYSALAVAGKIVREFAHYRLREWPPSGGYATAAVSTDDPELVRLGRALIGALHWNGPAMVEFRRGPQGYHFIELNPKFWGSLELGLAAGADFPGDLVRLAEGEDLTGRPVPGYKVGLRYWWPWRGDLRRLTCRPGSIGAVLSFAFNPSVRSNWSWRDPLPNVIEIGGELLYPIRRHD